MHFYVLLKRKVYLYILLDRTSQVLGSFWCVPFPRNRILCPHDHGHPEFGVNYSLAFLYSFSNCVCIFSQHLYGNKIALSRIILHILLLSIMFLRFIPEMYIPIVQFRNFRTPLQVLKVLNTSEIFCLCGLNHIRY